jgi:hypothetical protein
METIFWIDMVGGYEIAILAMEPAENRDDTTHHYPLYRVSIAWLPCHSTPPRQHARPVVGHLPGAARRLGLPGPVQCLLLAHRVDSLRCEGSDAIGAKRTCRERRERVDLTKMTHLGNGVCIAAIEMMLICAGREEQSSFLVRDH